MKSDNRLIETLNSLLADELAAINQYIVHAEMCEDWDMESFTKNLNNGQSLK